MAKELPYFRFTAQEWQNGDISLESYEYKGLFIDICSYYWVKNCSVTLAMLEKKFSNAKDMIEQLIELDIINMYDTENININFLDEQFDLLSEKRKKRSEAGRIGGLKKSSNAKAKVKQCSSYKDKDKEKDNYNLKEQINEFDFETLFMQLGISPDLIENYKTEFIQKIELSDEELSFAKTKTWLINWLKLQPKHNLKYLTEQEIQQKGLNPKRQYIFSTIDGMDYCGLLNEQEIKQRKLDINRVYSYNGNLVI